MITPLEKTPLHELLSKPILFDANIFMVGVENRSANKNPGECISRDFCISLLGIFVLHDSGGVRRKQSLSFQTI